MKTLDNIKDIEVFPFKHSRSWNKHVNLGNGTLKFYITRTAHDDYTFEWVGTLDSLKFQSSSNTMFYKESDIFPSMVAIIRTFCRLLKVDYLLEFNDSEDNILIEGK